MGTDVTSPYLTSIMNTSPNLSKLWLQEAVSESEGGSGELVHDGGVALVVVAVVVSVRLQAQLVQVDGVPAKHSWQEFVPCDVL